MSGAPPHYIHATALVIGAAGVLIRGPAGSGKSSLACRLIQEAGREGRFARLVGDDRISVIAHDGAVVARPHPAIAGRVERRSLPIAVVPYERACRVRLVIELVASPPRLPDEDQVGRTMLEGVELPLLRLEARNADHTCWLILHYLVAT